MAVRHKVQLHVKLASTFCLLLMLLLTPPSMSYGRISVRMWHFFLVSRHRTLGYIRSVPTSRNRTQAVTLPSFANIYISLPPSSAASNDTFLCICL